MQRRISYPIMLVLFLCSCSRPISSVPVHPPDEKIPVLRTTTSSPSNLQPTPTFTKQATVIPKGPSPSINPDNVIWLQNVGSFANLVNPSRVAWSGDSNSIGVVDENGLVVLDAHTLTSQSKINLKPPINLVDFSLDKGLLATAQDHQKIDFRKLTTGEALQSISPENGFGGGVFIPGGEQFATTQTDEIAAQIWNTNDGTLQGTLKGFETAAPVYQVVFPNDGKYMIWIARGTAQVMDLSTRKMGPQLSHEDFIIQADLSPLGNIIACASAGTVDGTLVPLVQLWNPMTGEKIGFLRDEGQAINAIDFSANGRLLAVGDEQSVTLWDVSAQQPVAVLNSHEGGVKTLAFSPDGRSLVTAGNDGILRVWQIVPPDKIP